MSAPSLHRRYWLLMPTLSATVLWANPTPLAPSPAPWFKCLLVCRIPYGSFGNARGLPGTLRITLSCSPCSSTPVGLILPRLFVRMVLPAATVMASAPTFMLTRLNHFTLTHYGSHGFLPTLKPDLAASAPRLDNGSWLDLTVSGSHRLYSQRRTGAQPSPCLPCAQDISLFRMYFGLKPNNESESRLTGYKTSQLFTLYSITYSPHSVSKYSILSST